MKIAGAEVSADLAVKMGFERERLGLLRYRVDGDGQSCYVELYLDGDRVAKVERLVARHSGAHAPVSDPVRAVARFPKWAKEALDVVLVELIEESRKAIRAAPRRTDEASRSDSMALKRLRSIVSSPGTLKTERNEEGRVVALRVEDWWSRVTLPPELGLLSELQTLEVAPCRLKRLPREIGRLRKLRKLNLFDCGLGSVPDEVGELAALEHMVLAGNPLKQFPDCILRLSHLKLLWMHDCGLRQLPSAFGALTELVDVSLSSNALTTLPRSVGELRSLKILRLEHNQLQTIPKEIGGAVALETLGLSRNRLRGLPASFASLRNLQNLSIDENLFREVPPHLLKLPRLTYIRRE